MLNFSTLYIYMNNVGLILIALLVIGTIYLYMNQTIENFANEGVGELLTVFNATRGILYVFQILDANYNVDKLMEAMAINTSVSLPTNLNAYFLNMDIDKPNDLYTVYNGRSRVQTGSRWETVNGSPIAHLVTQIGFSSGTKGMKKLIITEDTISIQPLLNPDNLFRYSKSQLLDEVKKIINLTPDLNNIITVTPPEGSIGAQTWSLTAQQIQALPTHVAKPQSSTIHQTSTRTTSTGDMLKLKCDCTKWGLP